MPHNRKWENFGDMNPHKYDGFFIRQSVYNPNMYYSIEVMNVKGHGDFPKKYLFRVEEIDMSEDINDKEVADCNGWTIEKFQSMPQILRAAEHIRYGHGNFIEGCLSNNYHKTLRELKSMLSYD